METGIERRLITRAQAQHLERLVFPDGMPISSNKTADVWERVNLGVIAYLRQVQEANSLWSTLVDESGQYTKGQIINLQHVPEIDATAAKDNAYLQLTYMYRVYKGILEGVKPSLSVINFEACKAAFEEFIWSIDFAKFKEKHPRVLPALQEAYGVIRDYADLVNMVNMYREVRGQENPEISKLEIESWKIQLRNFMESPIFLMLRIQNPKVEPTFVQAFRGVRDYTMRH